MPLNSSEPHICILSRLWHNYICTSMILVWVDSILWNVCLWFLLRIC